MLAKRNQSQSEISFSDILGRIHQTPIQYQSQELKILMKSYYQIAETYNALNWELTKSKYENEDTKVHRKLVKDYNRAQKAYTKIQKEIIKEYKKL